MNSKILVLEDHSGLREDLTVLLENRGFEVLAAESTKGADLLLAGDNPVDLMILDQNLGKNSLSGAQYAMTLRDREAYRNDPPECLIYSGETDSEYYHQAIELEVAVFISKGIDTVENMIPTVRALLFRHALKPTRLSLLDIMRGLIYKSANAERAMVSFCEEVIFLQLERYLDNPFFLIHESLEGITVFDSYRRSAREVFPVDFGDPTKDRAQEWSKLLANIPHGNYKECDEAEISLLCPKEAKTHPKEVLFTTLYHGGNTRLVLGFGEMEKSWKKLPDSIKNLAEAFQSYFKPNIFEEFKNLLSLFSENTEGFLRAGTQVCTFVGEELQSLYKDCQELITPQSALEKKLNSLKALSKEFQRSGDVLKGMMDQKKSMETHKSRSWRAVVNDLARTLGLNGNFSRNGYDFQLQHPKQIKQSISQLLAWMRLHTPEEGVNQIKITGITGKYNYLVIQDNGKRCPKPIREKLFLPFNPSQRRQGWAKETTEEISILGLFESRFYVENSKGCLTDRSDQLPGTFGHCFQISLPRMILGNNS